MPTATTKYSSNAGGYSSQIDVDQGQQVVVTLSTTDGSAVPQGVGCTVLRLVAGNRQAIPAANGANVLTPNNGEVVLSAPGSYVVQVPAGTSLQVIEYR